MTLDDYRNERLRKLAEIKNLGIDPYPAKSFRDTKIADIINNFAKLEGKTVTIAGRLTAIRSFGKLAFLRLRDMSGEVQIFMQANASGETYPFERREDLAKAARSGPRKSLRPQASIGLKLLKLLDTGDFIEATGTVGKSTTGEISVFAPAVRLLGKSLRPLPGRDGFTNKEERFRRRYVDMNVNPEVRERLVRRSKFWQATREFMVNHGFVEINVPVLEHTTGGADANPFITHMDALDEDFYLRISHELPLKRLLGGGFEKVFDIGPRFRNEGIDDEHLPEHIAFESYAAYEDYEDGMNLYEEMIKYVAKETWDTLKFHVGGFDIDLDNGGQPWPRVKYADLLRDKFGVDVFHPDREQLCEILRTEFAKSEDKNDSTAKKSLEHTLETASTAHLIDHVWKLIRKTSAGPFWLVEEPLELSPLAKKNPENPLVTERFHPIIAGTEMGNGFSELNDPLDQLARFKAQQAARDAGDSEAMMLDMDFVEMLEYGMPPACGWGNSERNFWLLEGVSGREAVPFPLIKQK
ncbi:lysine--tRNA ligase [Candidatus Saccharibacteria bacterium]|nr:lysine--tRNA ligase [Candidatus Saccharibacteria bacterium]